MEELHPQSTPEMSVPAKKRGTSAYEWVEWFIGVVIFVVLLMSFGFRTIVVHGESMEQTLLEGDHLIVTRIGEIENGDIVAITQPNSQDNEPLIKRVIATAGQTVDIDFEVGDVWVDGKLLNELYINERTYRFFDMEFPVTVPEGCVFVMGDNRNNSWDSRDTEIGFINEDYILGKAVLRFMPFNRFGGL